MLFVKRGVGGGLFRGEIRFHAEIEGTSPAFKDATCVRVVLKSIKCLEKILVEFNIEKFFPRPLLIG